MSQNQDHINLKPAVKVKFNLLQKLNFGVESKVNDFKRPQQAIDVESLKGIIN